ncbi:MAG: KH domain-containing protein [Candidatus Ancillula sp.]|jgi:predicted RNA-binding protein YlqC (UPF0109 family)|nr:KH domain-containing protein [Candidatus Ancillula sp.]
MLKEALLFMVRSVVRNPGEVNVLEKEIPHGTRFVVNVDDDDIGALIGRGGSTIGAIRTMMSAFAQGNNVHVEVRTPNKARA